MRLYYLTTKKYPSATADNIYVYELSRAFSQLLGDDFTLVVRQNCLAETDINLCPVSQPTSVRLINFSLFFVRQFIFRRTDPTTYFISNDQYLLLVVFVLRLICFKRYRVVFDAHLLSNTWRDKIILRLADKIITTSEVLKKNIQNQVNNQKKVEVIYGGVDIARYQTLAQHDVLRLQAEHNLTNHQVIGYVGSFTSLGKEKGLRTLIDALRYLPSSHVVLLVGGTESEVTKLRAYASMLGVLERCRIAPSVPFAQVPLYQSVCDVLVIPYPDLPHFRDFGFPMKVFEYLATGKPIVYSQLAIIDSFLSQFHNHTASFSPSNAQSMAQAIMTVQRAAPLVQPTDNVATPYSWKEKAIAIKKFIQAS
jgi:glycosyltransferase involved in cell wall biosynthesis